MGSVVGTARAIALVLHLRAGAGAGALRPSGSGGSGNGPVFLVEGCLPLAPNELQIGEVGGIPVLIDAHRYEGWGRPDLLVDIAPGSSDRLLLESFDRTPLTSRRTTVTRQRGGIR